VKHANPVQVKTSLLAREEPGDDSSFAAIRSAPARTRGTKEEVSAVIQAPRRRRGDLGCSRATRTKAMNRRMKLNDALGKLTGK
jgi:trans-aconitate methyltransferase